MFQTDSDKDVIFVAEKRAAKSHEITFDEVKRLALQRDIDEQSQPIQPTKPLTSQKAIALERQWPVERVKMKMEEEKSKEGFVKKQKKTKKEQASLPKTENCNFNDGSLAEVKKEKKKSKKVDAAVIDLEEESWNGGDEKEEKKKKKKKKRKIETESLNNASGSEAKNENDEVSKKKKKKKLPADGGNQVESSVKEEMEKKQGRKEKKLKNVSVQTKSGNVKTEKEEKEESGELDKLPKKAKKVKNNALFVSKDETEEGPKEKKKKRKKTIHEEIAEAVDEIIVTKKANKAKTNVTKSQLKSETSEGEVREVKKKRKKDGNEVKSETVIVEEEETELRMKGKKKKSKKATAEVAEVEETEPDKKKRKKGNSKGDGEEQQSLLCEEVEKQIRETLVIVAEDTTSKKKKKKKKISIKVEAQTEDLSLDIGAKKKKKKIKEEVEDQHESAQVDVVFLSEKSGNKDEVNINQERRQALQMEVDQASQPQRPAKPTGLGQWSTAQFNNSDQQQKFLRLMGGFKKGFQPAAASTGSANMALGKDAQQQLQQGLLGEFERAQSRRLDFNNRGTGLGFSAPSNKKFSIDVHACRSVRFDD